MVPEAWQNDNYMAPEKKAFYKWSAHTMEPWDGPGKNYLYNQYLAASLFFSFSICLKKVNDKYINDLVSELHTQKHFIKYYILTTETSARLLYEDYSESNAS